jgi:tight adherence protein C
MIRLLSGVFLGLGVFAGLAMAWRFAFPPKPSLAEVLGAIDRPSRPTIVPWWQRLAVGDDRLSDVSVSADLAVLNRSVRDYALSRVTLVATLAGIPVMLALLTTLTGVITWNPVVIIGFALIGGLLGFNLTRVAIGGEATTRRRGFVAELAAYTDMVSLLLASGAGVDEALWRAARNGTSPGIVLIRDALASARVRSETPWWALEELANRTKVTELAELVAAAKLAGSNGARIKDSLAAKGKTLRDNNSSYELGQAERASEAMGVPLIAMMLSFMILVATPAVVQILRFDGS